MAPRRAGSSTACSRAGAIALNIEDTVHSEGGRLREVAEHADLVAALRAAADAAGIHVVINARTDVILDEIGPPETRIDVAIDRLRAAAAAGRRRALSDRVPVRRRTSAAVRGASASGQRARTARRRHPGSASQRRESGASASVRICRTRWLGSEGCARHVAVSTRDTLWRERWGFAIAVALAMAVATVAVAAAYNLPIRDPDDAGGPTYVRLPAILLLAFLTDVVPRAVHRARKGGSLRSFGTQFGAVTRERWPPDHIRFALLGLGSWYLTYAAFRNLKSFVPVVNPGSTTTCWRVSIAGCSSATTPPSCSTTCSAPGSPPTSCHSSTSRGSCWCRLPSRPPSCGREASRAGRGW